MSAAAQSGGDDVATDADGRRRGRGLAGLGCDQAVDVAKDVGPGGGPQATAASAAAAAAAAAATESLPPYTRAESLRPRCDGAFSSPSLPHISSACVCLSLNSS
jgi:hypothetical protein